MNEVLLYYSGTFIYEFLIIFFLGRNLFNDIVNLKPEYVFDFRTIVKLSRSLVRMFLMAGMIYS